MDMLSQHVCCAVLHSDSDVLSQVGYDFKLALNSAPNFLKVILWGAGEFESFEVVEMSQDVLIFSDMLLPSSN